MLEKIKNAVHVADAADWVWRVGKVIASIIIALWTSAGMGVDWSRLHTVGLGVGLLLTLTFVAPAVAHMGARVLQKLPWLNTTTKTNLSKDTSATPNLKQTENQPPFRVRFKETAPRFRGSRKDHLAYEVLEIEVRNAIGGTTFDDVEVFIEVETCSLNTRKPNRGKIPKIYLENRRGVSQFKSSQAEDYVLMSRSMADGVEFWGDYKQVPEGDRQHIGPSQQNIITVTVLSKNMPRFTEKLVVINSGPSSQFLPVFPGPTHWIWNG